MYTIKLASESAKVSIPTVYNYTKRFAKFFSPTATPQKGTTRLFTEDDVRLLAYLNHKLSGQKLTYEQVEQTLDTDPAELEAFTSYTSPEKPPGEEQMQLVPRAELMSARLLVDDARQREQQALSKVDDLQSQVADLRYQLGKVEGELHSYKTLQTQKVPFWKRWFSSP